MMARLCGDSLPVPALGYLNSYRCLTSLISLTETVSSNFLVHEINASATVKAAVSSKSIVHHSIHRDEILDETVQKVQINASAAVKAASSILNIENECFRRCEILDEAPEINASAAVNVALSILSIENECFRRYEILDEAVEKPQINASSAIKATVSILSLVNECFHRCEILDEAVEKPQINASAAVQDAVSNLSIENEGSCGGNILDEAVEKPQEVVTDSEEYIGSVSQVEDDFVKPQEIVVDSEEESDDDVFTWDSEGDTAQNVDGVLACMDNTEKAFVKSQSGIVFGNAYLYTSGYCLRKVLIIVIALAMCTEGHQSLIGREWQEQKQTVTVFVTYGSNFTMMCPFEGINEWLCDETTLWSGNGNDSEKPHTVTVHTNMTCTCMFADKINGGIWQKSFILIVQSNTQNSQSQLSVNGEETSTSRIHNETIPVSKDNQHKGGNKLNVLLITAIPVAGAILIILTFVLVLKRIKIRQMHRLHEKEYRNKDSDSKKDITEENQPFVNENQQCSSHQTSRLYPDLSIIPCSL